MEYTMSIDSVFHPDSQHLPRPTDLTLVSVDHVQFHVHRDRVVTSSSNCFGRLLLFQVHTPLALTEPSSVVSLVLHLIYQIPFQSQPPATTILASFGAFQKYGLPSKQYLCQDSSLFNAILAHIPSEPHDFAMEIFIVASQNDLIDLAAPASTALLSYSPMSMDTAKARRIHPLYLKSLYDLHLKRIKALQQIMIASPPSHPETQACGVEGRQHFLTFWNIQVSQIVLSAAAGKLILFFVNNPLIHIMHSDTTSELIRSTLLTIKPSLACDDCKMVLEAAIRNIIEKWEETEVIFSIII